MAWKPKEKPLTPEEAVANARKELAPYWLGTEPLLAGVRGADGKVTVHPLDKSFDNKAWLLLFADVTDFVGERACLFAREWLKRYSAHELGFLLIARQTYSFMQDVRSLKPFLAGMLEGTPVVLDSGGLLIEAFDGSKKEPPVAKLLHQRKVVLDRSGPKWVDGTERELQRFLRLSDPGLPLSLPFIPEGDVPRDFACAELGTLRRARLFKITGQVAQEPERIIVHDASAVIRFTSPTPRVSIVAQSIGTVEDVSRIRVELNGERVYEQVAAQDLQPGEDDASSEATVGEGRVYHLLGGLPSDQAREITLRFPDAGKHPIALYGARFSN